MGNTNLQQRRKIQASNLVLLMLLIYPIINDYIWYIFNIFIPIKHDIFDSIVWIGVLMITAVYLFKKIQWRSVMLWLFFSFVALFSFSVTNYDVFSVGGLLKLIFTVIACLFIGANLETGESTMGILYKASVFALTIAFAYNIYRILSGKGLPEDNMGFAYEILPAVLIVIVEVFKSKRKLFPILIMLGALLLLLMQGTRGPMVCIIVFFIIIFLKKYGFTKSIVFAIFVFSALLILIETGVLNGILLKIMNKIEGTGFSTRVLKMFLGGEIMDDNGRAAIVEVLMEEIKNNPLKMRGLYADREWTKGIYLTSSFYVEDGTYAHNIILELVFNFGVLFGISAFLLLLVSLLRLIQKCSLEQVYLVGVCICSGFVYLFLSGSYLTSTILFTLIGLTMNKTFYQKYPRKRVGKNLAIS